jgi:hypothetical protein
MNGSKVIPLDTYRAKRHPLAPKPNATAGIPAPSPDRLWVLLDRNINIAVWMEEH